LKPKNTARWKQKKRLAVSPVIATILLIAITITVGFAAWAWVRSAALSSELNFGRAIGTNINCLSENFVIPNANFSSTKTNLVTVWFYNNGNGTVYVSSLTISNTTWAYNAPTTTVIKTGLGNSSTYNVGTNFKVGSLYTFTGVARCQGDIKATYQQVR
jgi:flagellin-like protein